MIPTPTRRAVPAALLAIAALAGPLAGGASALRLPRALDERTFKVEVKALQRTSWTLAVRGGPDCRHSREGQGSETVSLVTRRAERMTVKRYGTGYVILGDPSEFGGQEVTTRATVTRNGTLTSTPHWQPGDCGDNGGMDDDWSPPPNDCGTKRTTLTVGLDYKREPRSGFAFESSDLPELGTLFRNCPWTGGVIAFPEMLYEDARERPILARFSPSELFDRRFGQHILIARGSRRWTGEGLRGITRVRWEVRLTRVGR